MPTLDQSLHTAVHLVLSNLVIPSNTNLLMCSLDSSNRPCSTPSQYQGLFFFRSSLNGSR